MQKSVILPMFLSGLPNAFKWDLRASKSPVCS